MDGGHAPVGAVAAPGLADAGTVDDFERSGAGSTRRRPERERVERRRPELGAGPRASRSATEGREEGAEEGGQKGREEVHAEGCEEGHQEGREEDGAPEGSEEVRRAETRQEEGVLTQCKGTQLGAQAAGQEARAPLRR